MNIKTQEELDALPKIIYEDAFIDSIECIVIPKGRLFSCLFVKNKSIVKNYSGSYIIAVDQSSVTSSAGTLRTKDYSTNVCLKYAIGVARDKSSMLALDNSKVEAYDESIISAGDAATVVANGSSTVTAGGLRTDTVRIYIHSKSSHITALNNTKISYHYI